MTTVLSDTSGADAAAGAAAGTGTADTAGARTADTDTAGTAAAEAFADRILASALGAVDLMAVFVGDRLGWYRSLAEQGPATAAELAAGTATHPRYVREWLEQQAVSGILILLPEDDGEGRRFGLTPGAAEVLTDAQSLNYLAPLARFFAASGAVLPQLLDAYRGGGGVSWEQLGADAREAQADMNRPWFERLPEALATLPDVAGVLSREGARIADVGTGAGWSAIALAQAHPGLRVHGFDVDEPSIEMARRNAADAGVADRVTFHNADGDGLGQHGPFDAAFAFECIHDMPRPVDVLAAMRAAVPDGPVIVMDERVGDELVAPGDDVERLMYGFSLFCCLPDGMSHQPSAATGTVMRPGLFRDYARSAGFADIEVLPIEDFGFFRFYSLTR